MHYWKANFLSAQDSVVSGVRWWRAWVSHSTPGLCFYDVWSGTRADRWSPAALKCPFLYLPNGGIDSMVSCQSGAGGQKEMVLNPMSERWPRALAVGSQLCTRAESKQRLLYSGHSWHLPTCFISSIFQCLGTPHSLCLWLLEKIKHLFPFIETPNPFWYFLEANLLRITLCECFKIHGKMKSVVQVSLGAKKCFGDNFFS